MKECLRCGGSAYRDFAYGCDHQFWDDVIPEPAVFLSDGEDAPAWWAEEFGAPCARGWGDNGGGVACRGEQMHVAWASLPDGKYYVTYYPTREGARQLWREQYAIGLMVDSLFRKLTGWAKEGARLRAKREARTFDLRKLDVRMGSFSYPDPEDFTGGEHREQVRETVEEFTRKPYAVWCAEQGLDVDHAHAMSGTPEVPAGWPDNRTPEEKAAALVGRTWMSRGVSWHVNAADGGLVEVCRCEGGRVWREWHSPMRLTNLFKAVRAVEVT